MLRVIAYTAALIFLLSLMQNPAEARGFRRSQIPNGFSNGCLTCHVSSSGGIPRNAFGLEIEANFLQPSGANGVVQWGPALAALDSDGDGVSNGTELNDPNGSWSIGDPAPGDPNDVTNPGIVDTSPPTLVPGLSTLAAWLLVALLSILALRQLRDRPRTVEARRSSRTHRSE